jgi:acyl-[acyl-carrier-protein]-phospholipid O-acyltransferase / long-chain-fatty-acid--[acyl-carrier-protein] ligase
VSTVYIAWLIPATLVRFVVWAISQIFYRVRVTGAENLPKSGGALLVSNHVTYADAILIGCATNRFIRFLMWQVMYENKWLNPICRLFKTIPIPTNAPKESLRALRHAREEVEAGNLVCIFPEGGLTVTGHVKPFERGVEVILRGLNSTPVIPIYLDGLWGTWLSKASGPLRLRQPVTIAIGKPWMGAQTAESLHNVVLQLGTAAAETAKTKDATLAHRFVRAARRNGSRVALADSTGRELTFSSTLISAVAMKNWINRNCAGSQNIGVLLPASAGGAIVNLGIALAGKTAVNLNFTAGRDAMDHAIGACRIQTIFSSREFMDKIKIAQPEGVVFLEDVTVSISSAGKFCAAITAHLAPTSFIAKGARPDSIASILFSSGSTGTPKGVMLSHWNLLANIDDTAQVFAVGAADCMLGVLPFFHAFGLTYTLWFPMARGFKAVFHPNPTDAKAIGELAAAHRPTLFLSTPTFCLSYLRKCTREQFSSIRHLLVGAEKLRPALAQAFERKFGMVMLEGYGSTEMGPVVSVSCSGAHQPSSAGRMLPHVSARIVDPETLAPLPNGETGLLLVNGPSRMRGYLGEPERTASALVDGFYSTGDLARFDEHGFLYVVDRLSRFSKIAGEMVSHTAIEDAAREILGEHGCAVTAIPDDQRGERLVLLYTHTQLSPAELWRELGASRLPRLWIPKREDIHVVEMIPTLGAGKLDLQRIKRLALALAAEKSVSESF